MLDINGKERYFGFRELSSNGKCCVCSKPLLRGTKVIRINVGQSYGSICNECLDILNNVANGFNYDLEDSEFKNC